MSDYEYLLKCFGQWGIDSQLICPVELVDYIQTSDGLIGTSSWKTWFLELEYLWNHRSEYKIFDIVHPEPWLREQMEEAKEKYLAGEDLPGFPRKRTTDS
jgi:hypothetical protein